MRHTGSAKSNLVLSPLVLSDLSDGADQSGTFYSDVSPRILRAFRRLLSGEWRRRLSVMGFWSAYPTVVEEA